MELTRRQVLAGMAVGATRAAAQVRPGNGPKPRTTPAVCLYSPLLIKVPYDELGPVLRDLGADGCDLAVMAGGHVIPQQAPVDLMRAIEAITGVGLDVPVISTACTTLADTTIRTVAAIAGEMGVPLFRAGQWKYSSTMEVEARLGEVQRDIAGLVSLARAVNMSMAIQNVPGNVGAAIWDLQMILRGMDARTVGYDFDIGHATAEGFAGSWAVALRLALPRLKMATVRDFVWAKDAAGPWKMTPCPLGEGVVDWPAFFTALAGVRFTGPISIQRDYQPKDEIGAIRKDVEFVKKQVSAAYSGAGAVKLG